jgi:pimeloyl-ACP methyl ester carboxylesterase/membrane protease YdiL (CAAX protease family)
MTDSTIAPPLPSLLWPSNATAGSASPARTFFVATYVVAYTMWGLVALAAADVIVLPLPLMGVLFLGGFSPTLAALGMTYIASGTRGVTALLGSLFRWRVPLVWYGAALAAPALVVLAGVGTGLAVGSPLPPVPSLSAWLSTLVLIPVFILLAAIEEIGWRAYALPRLQARMQPLRASLLLGIAWAFWHAPQWFIPQTGQAAFPFPAFLIWVVALSIQFSWIYNGTRGSVLLVLLAHAATNAYQGPWSAALATLPEPARGVEPRVLVLVPQVVLSGLIVVLTRGRLGPSGLSTSRLNALSSPRVAKWGVLILGGVFAALTVLAGFGALVQAVATEHDRRAFPPPGRLVDVGGYRLHLQIMGEQHGGPTIILEAGLDSFSTNWYWVQTDLATSRRVVAYDRAGLGWSDVGPAPRDARQSATELHTALQASGIQGPYILAGHSYGGLVSRMFVDLYPDEIAGLALVDASHPDQWAHIPESLDGKLTAASNRALSNLASVGFLRMVDPVTPQVATGLPQHEYAAMRAIFALPQSSAIGADILAVWGSRTRAQVDAARPLGSLPLAVLSVTEQPLYGEVLTALQAELPALSSNSLHRVVAGATHENLISDRAHAAVVAETIRQVASR